MRPGRWIALAVVGLAAAGAVIYWARAPRPSQPTPPAPASLQPPPFSETRFRNAGPDAQYIGVRGCAKCHEPEHLSFLHTAHSRALGDVDLADEPPDATFTHQPSGRTYRVYRKDNALRHQEVMRNSDGQEVARIDVPVRYRIGSGSYTRSYLIEADGFLHVSPLTWYATKGRWGLSPGYDRPTHPSFERPADTGCLACHAGRVEPIEEAVHRVALPEKVIGCENCHGPGSLHRDLHLSKKHVPGQEDLTIVHPGKLSRPLLESICSMCHPSGSAIVPLRGRGVNDFRPGRPISDYRTEYQFDVGKEQMTVVGHLEQLRRSPCYQKSDMTCLTCHDPHQREKPRDPIEYYRRKCIDCHADQGCKLDKTVRLKKSPADDCVMCHMPRGDTEIPHIAFTHHRIGRHPAPPADAPDRVPDLVPVTDVSLVPDADRRLNLGTAYLMVSQDRASQPFADVFRTRAEENLLAAYQAGLRQGGTTAALAELFRQDDPERALKFARETLAGKGPDPSLRARTLHFAAVAEFQAGEYESALRSFEELTRLRRNAEDWRLLGGTQLKLGRPQEALAALKRALAIYPYRPAIHYGLARAYQAMGNAPMSQEHVTKGRWLEKQGQN